MTTPIQLRFGFGPGKSGEARERFLAACDRAIGATRTLLHASRVRSLFPRP